MKIRCPHCHNPIEVLDESSVKDIECPSCGSGFNLLRDTSTVSFKPEALRTIAHFDVIERLGVGSFGTVYKARDTLLDREVAIKVPRHADLDDAESESFLREARAAAQLRHPNIVNVFEVGRDGSTVYIVAELVDGLTLSDWLTAQRVTPREAVELCVKLADAVHHAHECGVIHRDLKPSNVMLNAAGEPFVMDFGLAKREAGEITMTVDGQIIGTPAYMAPEQARGESHQVDRRSDVYSLGVLLFELLTGERPFRGNARMLLYQVINDEPPSPRRLNAAIPKDLETICLKCLEKDRAKRFATAHDLGNELRRYLRGEPILSRPVSRAERMWRWSKRNPTIATLSASISVLILFLLVAGPIVYFREKQLRFESQSSESSTKLALRNAEQLRIAAQQARMAAENATEQAKSNEARATTNAELARQAAFREQDRVRDLEREKARLEIAVQIGFKFARGLETGVYRNADDAYADIFENGVRLPDDERAAMHSTFLALIDLLDLWREIRIAEEHKSLGTAAEFFSNAGRAIRLGHVYQELNRAIDSCDRVGVTWFLRGLVRSYLKHPTAEVIDDFHRAIELSPNCGVAYHFRGLCYAELGSTEFARRDFTKALQIDPQNDWARVNIAGILASQGEFAEATELLPDRPLNPRWGIGIDIDEEIAWLRWRIHYRRCNEHIAANDIARAFDEAIKAVAMDLLSPSSDRWKQLIAVVWRLTPQDKYLHAPERLAEIQLMNENAATRFSRELLVCLAEIRLRNPDLNELRRLTSALRNDPTLNSELGGNFKESLVKWIKSEGVPLELREQLEILQDSIKPPNAN